VNEKSDLNLPLVDIRPGTSSRDDVRMEVGSVQHVASNVCSHSKHGLNNLGKS